MAQTRRVFLGSVVATLAIRPGLAAESAEPRLLTARKASRALWPAPAPETPIMAFDGELPGPVLRVKLGEAVKLKFKNDLDAPTSIHWRGVRGPNASDGAAPLTQKPVAPGETIEIAFTPPDAGTFLYQPGFRPQAADQAGAGLCGMLVVEEAQPPAVDHEAVCLLSDWTGPEGAAPLVTANGARETAPIELAPGSRIRLRLANGSARRIMAIGFEGLRAQVAAIDGQPCDLFEPARATFPAAPGARFDAFFDLPTEAGAEGSIVLRAMSGSAEANRPLLRFVTKGEPRAAHPPLTSLPANPRLPSAIALEKATRADVTIDGGPAPAVQGAARAAAKPWTLNGQPASEPGTKPLFSVKRGTAVSLGFVNRSAIPHQMHVHGHVLRLLHLLDDGWEPYWRDAVIVPEGRTVRVAFVADNPGKWMVGSGLGPTQGPVTWFEVT